jgi:predicted short-subunit dehydrogenase-like oxidoreductase (DUF2520 family)
MRELERDLPADNATSRGAPAPGLLAIVGAGRVGRSLAAAAERAGLEVAVAGRDDAAEAMRDAGAVLLCVPDSAIAEAAHAVAAVEPVPPLVGHVSGATELTALAAAEDAGAMTFSLHPLQTVPEGGADFAGVPAAIAGSSQEALDFARELAAGLGMRPFEVAEEHRAAYHAAASIASNYLVALEESAVELLAAAGIEGGRDLLAPLVLTTAANWSELGSDALTGPIARGDDATVARHLEALRERAPELAGLYEQLAHRALRVKEAASE